MARTPFSSRTYALGRDNAGRAIELGPSSRDAAREMAATLAAIDPWKHVGWPAARLEALFAGGEPGSRPYLIRAGGKPAGAVAIEAPWLHGAYLRFLGIAPDYQNAGAGGLAMDWFEKEGSAAFRNLWVCVSGFNAGAIRFYERRGFSCAARLDELVAPGEAELLLRKRV